MADKLGLGSEVRELKIGSSFYTNKNAFHTMRYDFKPASVVSGSKHATIEIGQNQQVTVTHLESNGGGQTVFKGSRRPYQKECVLIIDKDTGEITLEKLTTNIQLKKTRPEGRSNAVDRKVGSPGQRARPSPRPSASPQIIHKSPPQVPSLSLSPIGAVTGNGTSGGGSLPMIEDCNDSSSSSFDIGNPLSFPDLKPTASPSFHDEQMEDGGTGGGGGGNRVGMLSGSSSSSSSDSGSSDSEDERPQSTAPPNTYPPLMANGHMNGNSGASMSTFLNDDLQLSESGSETD